MKKFIIISIILLGIIVFYMTPKESNNNLNSSNINNNLDGIAFYVQTEEGSEEYNSLDTIPSKDDGYVFKEAVCSDSSTLTFNNSDWSIEVSNMEAGRVRCKLYFDIDNAYAREYILAQNTINEGTPDFSEVATTNEGIFMAEDDYGTSYYYRGDVDNNYFYFAGYYWRIVRINGDGTIRLIYQGAYPGSNGVIDTTGFNSNSNNNAYLGFMYTLNEIHGTDNSSNIKISLETWYQNNLLEYEEYINVEQGFCNDRNNSTSMSGAPDNSGGTGTTGTYYAARHRVYNLKQPSFKCTSTEDLFTVASSSYGNNKLTRAIGLINVDEVAFAGGLFNNDNESYYLNTGESYWVMSPSHFSSNTGYIYNITSTGNLYRSSITSSLGVRPVINLNKNIKLEGTGTRSDPYRIVRTEMPSLPNPILANYDTILTRDNFQNTIQNETTGTIYYEHTSKGTTYYFVGSPTDNWVYFAGYYWRIVRINEDGSIRMILKGTATYTTGLLSNTSSFNAPGGNNMHVGYMYTSGQVHGLGSNSVIKTVLDNWYQNNLLSYNDKIDGNVGFCGDRTPSTSSSNNNGEGGTGTTETYYGAFLRFHNEETPTFECANESDLYTTSGSNNGNGALTYPIGLITVDEAWYAGGYTSDNANYYIYAEENYWTMSPSYYNGSNAIIYYIDNDGGIEGTGSSYTYGVRPVINLKANVTLLGSGTSTDPYIVN